MKDPTTKAWLEEMGTLPMLCYTPNRFAQFVRDEVALWGLIVKASGARAE